MEIHYDHLVKFFKSKPKLNEISDSLLQLGHEHELSNKTFDIEFTPNRGDCLSLNGLVRDLGVFFETADEISTYKEEIPKFAFNFTNLAPEACPKISFLLVEIDGDVSNYKDYLESYFSDLGINKNNFFTDISNYVAYELGQPTHCYDFDTISNGLKLEFSGKSYEFETLLDQKISLEKGDLIFTANDIPVDLAGVMGDKKTSCKDSTKKVIIEAAFFEPEIILGKSLKYDLNSDAAYKFERGIDPNLQEIAIRRFISIIGDHVKIKKLELFAKEYRELEETKLNFNPQKINHILGDNIVTEGSYKNYLEKLGFIIKDDEVIVPSYRSDIIHENDLAEEIARIIGYNNIAIQPLLLTKQNDPELTLDQKIKSFLINNGFFEVINSQFSGQNYEASIAIDNPLDTKKTFLRSNLEESLLENLVFNERRQKDSIKFFEISDIYKKDSQISYERFLGIVLSGRKGKNYDDFTQIVNQNFLIDIFAQINFDIAPFIKLIDRNNLDSKLKTPVFVAEIRTSELKRAFANYQIENSKVKSFVKTKPISNFPSINRDFSFAFSKADNISIISDVVSNFKSPILKESFMFDFYENTQDGIIKIAFRFIFQSFKKTLTDQEIEIELEGLLGDILKLEGVSIPGYSNDVK